MRTTYHIRQPFAVRFLEATGNAPCRSKQKPEKFEKIKRNRYWKIRAAEVLFSYMRLMLLMQKRDENV